jgi:hypothetical protein
MSSLMSSLREYLTAISRPTDASALDPNDEIDEWCCFSQVLVKGAWRLMLEASHTREVVKKSLGMRLMHGRRLR